MTRPALPDDRRDDLLRPQDPDTFLTQCDDHHLGTSMAVRIVDVLYQLPHQPAVSEQHRVSLLVRSIGHLETSSHADHPIIQERVEGLDAGLAR